uniref:Uncharacterized protein n=1 Tax=Trypanosoma congolense (strain IL3000) TaxID=1068625 RepID=G0UV53_TRYCI|nr:conserved hypothetical protein [Trypanosoma congolense IL3000]
MLSKFEHLDEEERKALDTVAELIASTIEGAESEDVHEVLSSSLRVPNNWQDIIQQKAEARRRFSTTSAASTDLADGAAAANDGETPNTPATPLLPELKGATALPAVNPTMRTLECPNCGTSRDVVDIRKSMRHSNTLHAVRELSNIVDSTFCPVCCGGESIQD